MTAVMRSAEARLQLSIMMRSSIRLSLTGGQVGWTRKMSRPRMSSSTLQKFSPSGNFPSVISARGKCRKLQMLLASGRFAWPEKIFSSRIEVLQQSVIDECLPQLRFAGRIERRHRQAKLAGIAAEHFHRGFNRDWIGREAQHVAAELEQLVMPLDRAGDVTFVPRLEH